MLHWYLLIINGHPYYQTQTCKQEYGIFSRVSFGGEIFVLINEPLLQITAMSTFMPIILLCPWLCVHMYCTLYKGPDQCTWTVQYRPDMTSPKLFSKLCQNHPTYLSLDALWPKHKKGREVASQAAVLCTHLLDTACDFTLVS